MPSPQVPQKGAESDDAADGGAVEADAASPLVVLSPEQVKALESGRSRMRGLARHVIGYVMVVVFLLPFSIYYVQDETHNDFWFLVVIGWMGMMIIHANYAMKPMLGLPSNVKKK